MMLLLPHPTIPTFRSRTENSWDKWDLEFSLQEDRREQDGIKKKKKTKQNMGNKSAQGFPSQYWTAENMQAFEFNL